MCTLKDHFSTSAEGVASWLTGAYEQKHCPSLQSPVSTLDTPKNCPQADSIHTEEEDRLVNAARQLKLYSFPHLVKRIKQAADANVNREIGQIRRVQRRQAFAEEERQRARFWRELQEDRLLTNKIKEQAENESRFSRQAEVVLGNKHAAVTAALNTPAEIGDRYTEDHHTVCDVGLNQRSVGNTSGHDEDEDSDFTDSIDDNLLSMWHKLIRQLKGPLPDVCLCTRFCPPGHRVPPWIACANNCRFYRRPEAYLKALLDAIRSME
ncbi:uncharacterized protein DEA37_0015235 [Paragonimus westermani]|uniref:Uncharacterized protein n=1 Tax=Paragonimus westermani TaxID=34504 RepID=A0A5J4P5A6_9TREM|nr:uncharacterized protein DEA37_0015235 [Paragonimus westermani]